MKTPDLDAFRAAARRAEFAAAEPFPHCVIDGFLRPEVAAAAREFDRTTDGWTYLHHVNEKKRILGDVDRMGPVTRAVVGELQSVPFVRALETLTGLEELRPDPDLDGAGLAEMAPGGFLNVHRDFLAHTTRTRWSRHRVVRGWHVVRRLEGPRHPLVAKVVEGERAARTPRRFTSTRRVLIRLDTWAVRVYSWLKRHTPIGDAWASRILRRL